MDFRHHHCFFKGETPMIMLIFIATDLLSIIIVIRFKVTTKKQGIRSINLDKKHNKMKVRTSISKQLLRANHITRLGMILLKFLLAIFLLLPKASKSNKPNNMKIKFYMWTMFKRFPLSNN